jgi:hypothetical protein
MAFDVCLRPLTYGLNSSAVSGGSQAWASSTLRSVVAARQAVSAAFAISPAGSFARKRMVMPDCNWLIVTSSSRAIASTVSAATSLRWRSAASAQDVIAAKRSAGFVTSLSR